MSNDATTAAGDSRRWAMATLLGVACMAWFARTQPAAVAEDDRTAPNARVLRVQKLVVARADGLGEIRLSIDEDGDPKITVEDRKGRPRTVLGAYGVAFTDSNGTLVAHLGFDGRDVRLDFTCPRNVQGRSVGANLPLVARSGGTAHFRPYDTQEMRLVNLTWGPDTGPFLTLGPAGNAEQIRIASRRDGAATIELRDQTGELAARLPE